MKLLAAFLALSLAASREPASQAGAREPSAPSVSPSGWKPICGGSEETTSKDLEQMARTHAELMRRPTQIIDSPIEGAGIDIVFVVAGTLPAGAAAALSACEAYVESVFPDPITVTINLSFQVLPAGRLGGTKPYKAFEPYPTVRAQIVSAMDGNDTIQTSLPTTGYFPVNYSAKKPSGFWQTLYFIFGGLERNMYFTHANWKAMGGVIAGADADMVFSTIYPFDYDPSNGVPATEYSFRDSVVHEVGHALGFCSGGDYLVKGSMILDLYRFQRTDGTGFFSDANPDTLGEFQVRRRLVAKNAPNDDHISDLISVEYRMSDGIPDQMSHFREESPRIGAMDPRVGLGETYHPNYYTAADLAMFDAIGYDL